MKRTDFMTDISSTPDIAPLESCLVALCPKDVATLVYSLENPPAPGPKLKALMRRVPVWRV